MDVKLTQNRVLVKLDEVENVSGGGLLLVTNAIDTHDQGTVIAVGPGNKNKDGQLIPLDVAVGEKVMFAKGTGIPVKLRGQEAVVIKEEEIYAILDND